MTSRRPIRVRWRDRVRAGNTTEDRAAALLARIPRPSLGDADRARIAEHLAVVAAAGRPRGRTLLWTLAAGFAGVALGVAAMAHFRQMPATAMPPDHPVMQLQALEVPTCAVARASGDDYRAVVVGPASASLSRRSIQLMEGRLEVATESQALDISVGDAS